MDGALAKMHRLDPVNRLYLGDYQRYLELRNLSPNTITLKLWKVYSFLLWREFRDARTAIAREIEDYYLQRKSSKSPSTVSNDITELRLFFAWLLPGTELVTFKPKKEKYEIDNSKVLRSVQVKKILAACETPRDRALVMIFWDSAARLSEVMDCNIKDVVLDRYGGILYVNGKTGRRSCPLTLSVPDLQAWLNVHPLKNNPEAPLFVTSRRRGSEIKRLNPHTVQNKFRALKEIAGLQGNRCNPHAFRHGRCTDLGGKLTEAELRKFAGWSGNSSMASVYVHLSGRDVRNKILEIAGFISPEKAGPDPVLNPAQCPRCQALNPSDAMYCSKCSMALTDEAAKQARIIERAALSEKTLREIVRDEMEKEGNRKV
jgi:integrase